MLHAQVHFCHQPGMAPMVFINPKTDPASFGAKSCGFTMTALLWNPELAITQVEQKTASQKLRIRAGNYNFFCQNLIKIIYLFFSLTHDKKPKCLRSQTNRFNYFPSMCD
jgi:hypothetical protein